MSLFYTFSLINLRQELSFNSVSNLTNSWNEGKPVKIGRDGQVGFKIAYQRYLSFRKLNQFVDKPCVVVFLWNLLK